MINKGLVKGYALALFYLASDKNQFLNYKQDAKDIIKVVRENKKFIDFLSSGNINTDKKAIIIKKVFMKIDKNITNLILILINKRRIK